MVAEPPSPISPISPISPMTLRHGLIYGKIKRCALVNFCFSPDPAAMTMNNPLHSCQTDAGTGKFGLLVHPLKCAK